MLSPTEHRYPGPFQSSNWYLVQVSKNLYPAFRDGHAHPLFAGREALGPEVSNLKSVDEIVLEVKKWAEQNSGDWIVGGAYDRSLAPSFMASWLDSAVPDRPVVLHASDHHTIWVNSEALRRAGVLESFPAVTIGHADLDEAGRPTGTLRESGAMEVVLSNIPPRTLADELKALDWAQEKMLSVGITQVQDAWIEPGMAEIFLEALDSDRLAVATNLAFRITPENYEKDYEYFQNLRAEVANRNSPLLTLKTAKFFADGVFGSGTASVLDPYLDGGHGEPVWDERLLQKATAKYAEAGYQLHIHAIGDAAVRSSLDAIENCGSTELPSVITHAELVNQEDVPRFAKLGVIANFQPLWAKPDSMLLSCKHWLDEDRLEQKYALRTFIDSGVKVSFGSDWPVSSNNPLLGIQTAVTREYEGKILAPKQRITLSEALYSHTAAVTEQLGGSIGEEQIALSHKLEDLEPHELGEVRVEAVFRGGETIWES